jgi:AcrR family transcriptional regulator
MEDTTLSRRERERLMRREAMLEAAKAVFAEKGYPNATIEEIAQRAEFGKGTIYNYFEGGKEDLFFAVFDELYDDLCTVVKDSFDSVRFTGKPVRTVFHGFLTACFTFFQQRRELFLILTKEAHRMCFDGNQDHMAYLQRQTTRLVETLAEPLEKAVARGELKSLSPNAMAHVILGNVKGLHMHQLMAGISSDIQTPTQAADFLTTVLFDGLLVEAQVSSAAVNHE